MKAREPTPAKKKKKKDAAKRAARREPSDLLVARALERLAVVDRKDAVATARALSDVFATLAAHLDSAAIDEPRQRALARRIRAARLKILGRRPKRRAVGEEAAEAPPHVPTQIPPARSMPAIEATRIVIVDAPREPELAAEALPAEAPSAAPSSEPETAASVATVPPETSWLPKTLHAAGVVEGHEPTAVLLGLLREALDAATTKRVEAADDEAAAVRPLPAVLADLFGAFGLSRSPAPPPPPDDSTET
jgi:hypothetical protein